MNEPTHPQNMGPSHPGAIAPWLLITFIVVILAAGGYVGWWYWNQAKTVTPTTTTPSTSTTTSTTSTADWKTYTNTDYSFSFKYPADLVIKNETSILKSDSQIKSWLSLTKSSLSNEPMADNATDYYTIVLKIIDGDLATAEQMLGESNGVNKTIKDNQYKFYATRAISQEGNKGQSYLLEKNDKTYAWSIVTPDINTHAPILSQILPTFQFTK